MLHNNYGVTECGPTVAQTRIESPRTDTSVGQVLLRVEIKLIGLDHNGWFNTRDLARVEDENLFITGRTKELIIRSGFNVYPAEVEAVLNSHPQVLQPAVVGQEAEQDEEIIAFVQRIPDSEITALELAECAARYLGHCKRPSKIILVKVMPPTPTWKIAELAELAAVCS